MIDFAAAAAALVAELTDAGIRAAVDGRDLNPPAVQVRPPTVSYRFGRDASADWELWAVVPDTGNAQSLAALSSLVDDVQFALGGAVVQARPDAVVLADGGTVPAYVLTLTRKIPRTTATTA